MNQAKGNMMNYTGLNLGLGAFAKYQLDQNEKSKQEAKETEQRTYERNRQAVADQQNAGLYEDQRKISGQQFEQNKFTLGGLQRKENEEVKNQQNTEHLRSLYGMHADDNLDGMIDDINPRIQTIKIRSGLNTPASTQQMKYVKNADGTVSLNVYDGADPTKLIRTQATGLTKDDLLNRGRAKYDPDGSMEAKFKNDYENAKAVRDTIVDDRKAKRDHDYKIEEVKEQGKNAQTLAGVNGFIGYQRDRANWDDRGTVEQYKIQNQPSSGKAGTLTPVFGDLSSLTANDMLPFIVGRETNGVHYGANGGLITSPAGAQGITQVMPKTGVNPGYGVVPLRNTSADEYKRFGHDYYDAMLKEFGGDHTKALAAYNAGPGAVQNAVAVAQKNGGNWLNNLPVETQKYVPGIVSKVQASRNAAQSTSTARQVGANVEIVAKQIAAELKGNEESGINPASISATLFQASDLLANAALAPKGSEQQKQYYNNANQIISGFLSNSNLSPQQQQAYSNKIMANLYGENSLIATGIAMDFNNPQYAQRQAKIKQQASVSGVTNNPSFAGEDKSTPPAQPKSVGKANLASTKPKTEAQQIVEKAQTSIAANKNRQYTGLNTTKLNQMQKQKADLSNKLAVFDRQTAQLQSTVNELEQSVKNNPELARGVNLWGRKSEIDTRKKQRAALARQAGDAAEQFDELQRQANRPQPTSGIGVATMKRG